MVSSASIAYLSYNLYKPKIIRTFVNRNIYASNQSHYMEYYDPRLYVSSWLGLEHWGVTWNVNNFSVSNVDEVDGILRC